MNRAELTCPLLPYGMLRPRPASPFAGRQAQAGLNGFPVALPQERGYPSNGRFVE